MKVALISSSEIEYALSNFVKLFCPMLDMKDFPTAKYIVSTCIKPSQNISQGRSKKIADNFIYYIYIHK